MADGVERKLENTYAKPIRSAGRGVLHSTDDTMQGGDTDRVEVKCTGTHSGKPGRKRGRRTISGELSSDPGADTNKEIIHRISRYRQRDRSSVPLASHNVTHTAPHRPAT